jgi:hypothetical protein
MFVTIILSPLLLLIILQPSQSFSSTHESVSLVTIQGEGPVGICPSRERRNTAIQNIIQNMVVKIAPIVENCGPGDWYRVASLNMSDPSQQCPSAWREYNTSGVRACGIRTPGTNTQTCIPISYPTSPQYSRVCGRAIGYQIGSPDAFGHLAISQLDSYYVYGVSITHGTPRSHIWTYAAGVSEGRYGTQRDNCPCSNPGHLHNAYPPSFFGDNYYCESGNPTNTFIFIPKIDSGMASSVKVSVAAMGNLLHGSVWSYPTQQLMILRCVFAVV